MPAENRSSQYKLGGSHAKYAESLTIDGQTRSGCELGHVDDLDRELLSSVSVDASPHQTERTPKKKTREISKRSQYDVANSYNMACI